MRFIITIVLGVLFALFIRIGLLILGAEPGTAGLWAGFFIANWVWIRAEHFKKKDLQ